MFFTAAIREETKKEFPGLVITELAKKMGAKWRALTDEEKMPFNEKAKVDKERYLRDMETYKKK